MSARLFVCQSVCLFFVFKELKIGSTKTTHAPLPYAVKPYLGSTSWSEVRLVLLSLLSSICAAMEVEVGTLEDYVHWVLRDN